MSRHFYPARRDFLLGERSRFRRERRCGLPLFRLPIRGFTKGSILKHPGPLPTILRLKFLRFPLGIGSFKRPFRDGVRELLGGRQTKSPLLNIPFGMTYLLPFGPVTAAPLRGRRERISWVLRSMSSSTDGVSWFGVD